MKCVHGPLRPNRTTPVCSIVGPRHPHRHPQLPPRQWEDQSARAEISTGTALAAQTSSASNPALAIFQEPITWKVIGGVVALFVIVALVCIKGWLVRRRERNIEAAAAGQSRQGDEQVTAAGQSGNEEGGSWEVERAGGEEEGIELVEREDQSRRLQRRRERRERRVVELEARIRLRMRVGGGRRRRVVEGGRQSPGMIVMGRELNEEELRSEGVPDEGRWY